MGAVVLFMSVSVDGYMAGPHGELDWHLVDAELHQHFNETLRTMSAFIDGRVTYELMADFWPTADRNPASTPTMVEFAGIWRDMPKYVFSRTLDRAGWNSTVLPEVSTEAVAELKQRHDGDLALGGAELAREFLRLGLVDGMRLYVHPVVIGRGRPLFTPADVHLDLALTETRTFGNGVVLLHYRRA